VKIGFGRQSLTGALDLASPPAPPIRAGDGEKFSLETKFDITDRVEGLWRADEAGERRIVDDLYVRVMAGRDEDGPWAVLNLDLCELSYRLVDACREPLVQVLGYRPERVLCMPTHCHVSVSFHADRLRDAILAAVRQAETDAAPADVAALTLNIDASRYVVNRRVHVPGVGTRCVMFNDFCETGPDHLVVTEQVGRWIENLGGRLEDFVPPGTPVTTHGEVNPRLQALFVRDARTGTPLGALTAFAAHPVIVSEKKVNGDISADYPGYLKRHVEERLGGICLFAQGASGDLRPLFRDYTHETARRYGQAMADMLVDAAEPGLSWERLDTVRFALEPVTLPLRAGIPRDDDERREALARIDRAYDRATDIEERRRLQDRFWFTYPSSGVRSPLRPEWEHSGTLPVNLYALRLNGAVLLAAHGEVFHETGEAMIAPFASRNPILATVCNEELGYLPTREEFERGGFETATCVAEPGSTDRYVEGAHRLLGRIYGGEAGDRRAG